MNKFTTTLLLCITTFFLPGQTTILQVSGDVGTLVEVKEPFKDYANKYIVTNIESLKETSAEIGLKLESTFHFFVYFNNKPYSLILSPGDTLKLIISPDGAIKPIGPNERLIHFYNESFMITNREGYKVALQSCIKNNNTSQEKLLSSIIELYHSVVREIKAHGRESQEEALDIAITSFASSYLNSVLINIKQELRSGRIDIHTSLHIQENIFQTLNLKFEVIDKCTSNGRFYNQYLKNYYPEAIPRDIESVQIYKLPDSMNLKKDKLGRFLSAYQLVAYQTSFSSIWDICPVYIEYETIYGQDEYFNKMKGMNFCK